MTEGEGGKCDFCSSPDVRWAYPCRDFTTHRELTAIGLTEAGRIDTLDINLDAGMAGAWAACPACYALIQRGDRDRLARRSAKRMVKLYAESLSLSSALTLVRPLHDQFWANREGAPVPTSPGAEDPT